MTRPATPDEVVAANIKRLRGRTLSRQRLSEELACMTERPWTESTIKDLEGARSADRGPRSARWTELIDLALFFEVSIFDLVLPVDRDTRVVLTRSSTTVDKGQLPDGERKTSIVGYESRPKLAALGVMLFRIPGDWLSEATLGKLVDGYDVDLASVLHDAKTTAEGLQRAIETLEEMRLEQTAGAQDGIDS
jgi:hypothetical protein